jgi:hypothetical protein
MAHQIGPADLRFEESTSPLLNLAKTNEIKSTNASAL